MPRRSQKQSTKRANPLYKARVSDVANLAMDGVRAIRKLINSETQVVDINSTAVFTASVAQVVHLTAIAQGDGQDGRTGNSVLLSYIKCNEFFVATVPTIVREILFQDMQQISDTTPSASDILEVSTDPMSYISKTTAGRFKILEDKVYTLESGNKGLYRVARHTKTYNHHVKYNGAATTDIQKGGIYRLILPSAVINQSSRYRVGFHDN